MEISTFCYLCKNQILVNQEKTTVNKKTLCRTCFDFVSSNKPEFIQITLTVSENFHSVISNCSTHNKKFKLKCLPCNTLMCSVCCLVHSTHRFELLSETLQKIFLDLSNLEFSIQYSLACCPSDELRQLYSDFSSFYSSLSSVSTKELLASVQTEELYSRLIHLNPEFKSIPLASSKDLCQLGRKNLNLLSYDPTVCNLEWGEKSIHIFSKAGLTEMTQLLPNNSSALLYCRSVWLPFDKVLICGGRKTAADFSLPDAFILSFAPSLSLRTVEPMLGGRSNHFVIYCNDFVYVVGGLDGKNNYTNNCMKFSLKTEKWASIASLIESRDTVGGCCDSFKDCIYVFGGKHSETCFSFEKYSINDDSWKVMPLIMPYECCIHGVFYLPCKESALVFAGQNGNGEPLKSTFFANFATGEVVLDKPLPYKGGPVVEHPVWNDGKVLCLFFDGFLMRKLMTYDLARNSWHFAGEVNSNENN